MHGTLTVYRDVVFQMSFHIHPMEVPQGSSAVSNYRQQGGHLTDPNSPGADPLDGDDVLCSEREQTQCGIDLGSIYSQSISGNIQNAITTYRDITFRLAQ